MNPCFFSLTMLLRYEANRQGGLNGAVLQAVEMSISYEENQ